MLINIKLVIIFACFLFASCEKSKYRDYQIHEVVKFVDGTTGEIISSSCLVASTPSGFPKATDSTNMKLHKIFYNKNFDFCNTTVVPLVGYEAAFTTSSWCGMIQQKAVARSLDIKILVYIVSHQVSLPSVQSELNEAPAVVLMPENQFKLKMKDAKVGILVLESKVDWGKRVTEVVIFGLVVVTIAFTMAITIGFTKSILTSNDSLDSINVGNVKYIVLILPISMVGMLLLLYFFYSVMVWFVIIVFYFLSAFCFAMIFGLFLEQGDCCRGLKKPFNKFGIKEIDYRYVILYILGLVISTIWIVLRNNTVGLALNNVMGVYVCIEIAISFGVMFVVTRNFRILFTILAIVLLIDAVMVYVPIKNTNPDSSQQLPLFPNNSQVVRLKRNAGNSIMENVATAMGGSSGEEVPVRFKIPLFNLSHNSSDETCYVTSNQYSLIGFGDLILPGAFIVYMLVFAVVSKSNVLLYFLFTLFGYVIGFGFACLAVHMSTKGQPALVFLLPCTVLPALFLSIIRKEFNSLWHNTWFSEISHGRFNEMDQLSQDQSELTEMLITEEQKQLLRFSTTLEAL